MSDMPEYIQGREPLRDGYRFVYGDCGQVVGQRRLEPEDNE